MTVDTYIIQVNQFTDGPTGHVNLTYIGMGIAETYGANLSPSSGVQREDYKLANPPAGTSFTQIQVTQEQFNQSLAFSRAADLLNNSYFGLCNNCADYVNAALKPAGLGDWALAQYLRDGTLTDTYIKAAKYICSNEYVNLATSNLLNILASTQNVNDAVIFVNAMSWLSDHERASEFYQNIFMNGGDADSDASNMLYTLKRYAAKLGISVTIDPIEEKIALGIASPIVIDLDGDGIQTTSYSAHAVTFDIDGDGTKDRTAWISGNDAFLAIDSNENELIDGVNELFGGMSRGDGYAKLADFDSNGDDLVNNADACYSYLKVWKDENMNGITDANELRSAASAGLDSISIIYQSQDIYQNNNLIGEVSQATVKRQTVEAGDIYFRFKSGSTDALNSPPESATLDNQINSLISAMAAFSPAATGISNNPDIQTMSFPTLSANWA